MTCPRERIVAVLLFILSQTALAGGLAGDSSGEMSVANIAPEMVNPMPSIPDAQRYVHRYEMQYQTDQARPFYTQIENFYSAQDFREFRLQGAKAKPEAESAGSSDPVDAQPRQQASNALHIGPSTAPQISLIQLPNTTTTIGAQPQRRLSLILDSWIISGTARVAMLHSHDTGATLTVRHGF